LRQFLASFAAKKALNRKEREASAKFAKRVFHWQLTAGRWRLVWEKHFTWRSTFPVIG